MYCRAIEANPPEHDQFENNKGTAKHIQPRLQGHCVVKKFQLGRCRTTSASFSEPLVACLSDAVVRERAKGEMLKKTKFAAIAGSNKGLE